jgi:16S rRNA (guanine966-N2)-methyltransferase
MRRPCRIGAVAYAWAPKGGKPQATLSKVKNSGKTRGSTRAHDAPRGAREAAPTSRILRIIGGKHRGRKLRFPAGVAIRPTPDRVRETLFNWLQPRIAGARVLDLFAGSGALGLEALSRGAGQVTFVERDRRAAAAIDAVVQEWQESVATVACADALAWLARDAGGIPFDVVFLDPPYDSTLLSDAARMLADSGRLATDARIYVEHRARDGLPVLPDAWQDIRDGRAGEVGYHLFAI